MDRPVDTSVADLGSRDYEVSWFQAGDFVDNHGNHWCNAAFVGVSEPVTWVVKDPATVNVGDKVYGKFTLETARTGRKYLRFRREQKPEQQEGSVELIGQAKPAYQPRDLEGIARSVALKAAVDTQNAKAPSADEVLSLADKYLAWLQHGGESLKAEAPTENLSPEEQVALDQAKRDAERIRNTFSDGTPLPDEVITDFDESEPIDLKDIPF